MSNLQGLLHDSLLATGHVECCTIIGRKDGTIKASSAGYEPTGEQVDALMSAFRETGSAREHGIHFNGATYKCVRADKNSIYAKKEGSGFVAARTGSLIAFGSYSSSMFPSVCVEAVERLGEEHFHAEVSDIKETIGWGPAGEDLQLYQRRFLADLPLLVQCNEFGEYFREKGK